MPIRLLLLRGDRMKTQTFNDGVANIYSVSNIAEPGNKPKDKLTLKVQNLHYEERIVGMGRFWKAMQNHTKINRLLRMPRLENVSSQDFVIPTDGKQYKVVQVQYPEVVFPPVMDVSLERLEAVYEVG